MKKQKFNGRMVIKLFNAETGELEDQFEHTNRFTPAVNKLVNKMPYAMNSAYAVKTVSAGTEIPMLPLSQYGLGGIILYPQAINSDQLVPDPLYCFDQNPTGFASREAYSGDDVRRGNISSSSTPIEDGTGYRFVYDFTQSQGNGYIGCVCLTSRAGGCAEMGIDENDIGAEPNYRKVLPSANGQSFLPVLCTDNGIYHLIDEDSKLKVYFLALGNTKLGINDNYPLQFTKNGTTNDRGTLVHEFETLPSNYCFAGHGNEILLVSDTSNTTLNIRKYNVDTDTETTMAAIDVYTAANLYVWARDLIHCGYDGTSIYVQGNDEAGSRLTDKNIVRINLTTPADAELIDLGQHSGSGGACACVDGYLSGEKFIYFPSKSHKLFYRSSSRPFAIGRVGIYNIYYGDTNSVISAGIFSPYLATINNLSEVKQKQPSQTMQIIYEVTPATE